MKNIIIACGAGLATSTMVSQKVSNLLDENWIPHKITQCILAEVKDNANNADLIITTMKIDEDYGAPYIHGGAFLTGINEEEVSQQILDILRD